MCTAISIGGSRHLFGRTLDVPASRGERVIAIPRRVPLAFLHEGGTDKHFTVIGIGIVSGGFPLLFEGMNEAGLSVAALNFPLSARYGIRFGARRRLASFEVIPYLLASCESAESAAALLSDAEITAESVSPDLPSAPLHWLVADAKAAYAIEPLAFGLEITKNQDGVLTNEPPFPDQSRDAAFVSRLTARTGERGAWSGAAGLAGDFSSSARYARALFVRRHAAPSGAVSEAEAACRFLRLLDTVSVPRGVVVTDSGEMPYTVYASCFSSESLCCYLSEARTRSLCRYRFRDELRDGSRLFFPQGEA